MANSASDTPNRAVVHLAQYLAGLTVGQDIWEEAGAAVTQFFGAEFVGFCDRAADGSASVHPCKNSDPELTETITGESPKTETDTEHPLSRALAETVKDVFDNGFFACRMLDGPPPAAVVCLPLTTSRSFCRVLLVGHAGRDALEKPLVDAYVAVSGLIETTADHLAAETERLAHRERTAELQTTNRRLQKEIVQRQEAENRLRKNQQRLARINECLASLGLDHQANITILTGLCGELLNATCALYNRLENPLLCSVGQWNTPTDYVREDSPDGHICYDVIRREARDTLVVRNLQETPYFDSDPNVARYGLKTYAGHPVLRNGRPVGSLCVVYQADVQFAEADKRILGIVASALSTEEDRSTMERALRVSEELFSKAFHSGPMLMSISDVESGRYIEVNDNFLRVTGFSREEAVGKTSEELGVIREEDWESMTQTLREKGRVNGLELSLRKKSGEPFFCLLFGEPISVAGEQRLLSIGEDITQRKQAEEDARAMEDQLRQAQKMQAVGQLAGGVAHDFNNLLMGIMNYVELCRDEVDENQPIRGWLDQIMRDSKRSATMVRQLLAFARKQTIQPQVLDLNDTVAGMLHMLRRLIGENVELKWIPGAALGAVSVDPAQIDQLLANLTVNARDAVGENGTVTVRTRNETVHTPLEGHDSTILPGEYVLLEVADDGCGMDEATQEKIFEPFFTTKEVGLGTGLGLATVYGIVTQNGGIIEVESELGNGAIFRVYLPRAAALPRQDDAEDGAAQLAGGSETILLVEDEPAVRKTASIFLERLGYAVRSAESPAKALRMIEQRTDPPHLLVTDVVMPGMNGYRLAKRVRSAWPECRCLFMSGYSADAAAREGLIDATDNFLSKPFGRDDLARKVREVLDAAPQSGPRAPE